jgi:hypothetical protein
MRVTKIGAAAPANEAMPGDETNEATPEPSSGSMMEDCVPLDALAMPDESEQMENPSVGDKVQYTVEGTLSRIEGDNAYVTKTAVNGQKVEGKKSTEPEPPDDMGALEQEAKSMSETPQY